MRVATMAAKEGAPLSFVKPPPEAVEEAKAKGKAGSKKAVKALAIKPGKKK